MKKLILTITAIFLSTLLLSCGVDDSKAQMISSISISQNDNEVDIAKQFFTESEAIESLINEAKNDKADSTYSYMVQNNRQDGIYIYSPECIPNDFELEYISASPTIRYVYTNKCEEIFMISWSLSKSAEDAIDDIKEINTLFDISNKPGYYYCPNGNGVFIYWSKDGYLFSSAVPPSVGSVNPETHEYSGEDVFALKKTFYPFEKNEVVE